MAINLTFKNVNQLLKTLEKIRERKLAKASSSASYTQGNTPGNTEANIEETRSAILSSHQGSFSHNRPTTPTTSHNTTPTFMHPVTPKIPKGGGLGGLAVTSGLEMALVAGGCGCGYSCGCGYGCGCVEMNMVCLFLSFCHR